MKKEGWIGYLILLGLFNSYIRYQYGQMNTLAIIYMNASREGTKFLRNSDIHRPMFIIH